MTDTLAAFTAALAQRLHNHDRAAEGRSTWPLRLTPHREAEYLARARAVMDVLPGLLAESDDYAWPTGCGHYLGALPCRNPEPHKGNGVGCVHDSTYVSDAHDRSEAIQ